MPFDEEDPKDFVSKIGLKPIGGQKSMFEKKNKTSQQEFQQEVQRSQEKLSGYKKKASELFIKFNKNMSDKTLVKNKNILNVDFENEMLQEIIQLGIDINNDPNEKECMGSLTCITFLLKTCLSQRDRINEIEYILSILQNKFESINVNEIVNKEVNKLFDLKKK